MFKLSQSLLKNQSNSLPDYFKPTLLTLLLMGINNVALGADINLYPKAKEKGFYIKEIGVEEKYPDRNVSVLGTQGGFNPYSPLIYSPPENSNIGKGKISVFYQKNRLNDEFRELTGISHSIIFGNHRLALKVQDENLPYSYSFSKIGGYYADSTIMGNENELGFRFGHLESCNGPVLVKNLHILGNYNDVGNAPSVTVLGDNNKVHSHKDPATDHYSLVESQPQYSSIIGYNNNVVKVSNTFILGNDIEV